MGKCNIFNCIKYQLASVSQLNRVAYEARTCSNSLHILSLPNSYPISKSLHSKCGFEIQNCTTPKPEVFGAEGPKNHKVSEGLISTSSDRLNLV